MIKWKNLRAGMQICWQASFSANIWTGTLKERTPYGAFIVDWISSDRDVPPLNDVEINADTVQGWGGRGWIHERSQIEIILERYGKT